MDSALPQLQKAWQVVRQGSPAKALAFKNDLPVPTKLAQGEVLVKVLAAALNPVGYKLMSTMPNLFVKRPTVAEYDLSGEIVLANGTEFKVGDEVFGIIPADIGMKTGNGALQEYAAVAASHLVLKPKNIDFTTAAGIALAGLTAYEALVDTAQIEEGQHVFINGGSSSVGGLAVQLAKAKGCKVSASCSGRNFEYVKGLGADEVYDYTASPLHEQLVSKKPSPPFHVIFDTVDASAPLFVNSSSYLTASGIYVSTGPNFHTFSGLPAAIWGMMQIYRPTWLGGTNRKFKIFLITPSKANLQALADLIAAGKIKPQVDSVFSLEDVPKAYERIMSGRAKGKVVVQML